MQRSQLDTLTTWFFAGLVLLLLLWGWSQRFEYWVRAEDGLGYFFGIAGATMMALIFVYPFRKKLKFMRSILPMSFWFKGHMLFGILGPCLILFHCNFSLGSLNSNVALFSMLLVVLSGLIGRYIYRHTHNGLYGKKLNLMQLHAAYFDHKEALLKARLLDGAQLQQLQQIEALTEASSASLAQSWRVANKVNRLTRAFDKNTRKLSQVAFATETGVQLQFDDFRQHLGEEMKLQRAMANLSLYNRLFSLWHVLHLPVFFMLIVTAIVHIFVVHMY
jgi:hypothetical protein